VGSNLHTDFASDRFDGKGVLFDDVEAILRAQEEELVDIDHPGVVVLCPIISEQGAEAPGNNELPEIFAEFDLQIKLWGR
jgi:hypothetical protein